MVAGISGHCWVWVCPGQFLDSDAPLFLCKAAAEMLATPKLLITDDDAALRESLATALTRRGFHVAMAADGREGLDLAVTPSIHLVIVDYQMPRLSGLEMLAQLRAVRPELPCILMSGALDETVAAEARKMRVYSVLGKPLRLREMDVQIRKALGDVYGWPGVDRTT